MKEMKKAEAKDMKAVEGKPADKKSDKKEMRKMEAKRGRGR